MNKKAILAGLFALSTLFAVPTFAQQPQGACDKAKSGQCAKGNKGQQPTCASPFEDLNLTAEQQSKLDALKQECQQERQAAKEQQQTKKAEQKQAKAEAMRTARAEKLAKIKAILTPEQYVQFLENAWLNAPQGKQNVGPRQGKELKEGKKLEGRGERKAKDGQFRREGSRPQASQQTAEQN